MTSPGDLGPESLYGKLMATGGDTLRMEATRDPLSVIRGGPREAQATISAEAVEELTQQVRLWLGTRLLRHVERTGRGAHNVALEVKVETTGPLEPGGEAQSVLKLVAMDGRYRLEAIRDAQV